MTERKWTPEEEELISKANGNMTERKWTPEEEELIAKVIMSPYGKRKLRAIIQKAGAEFADSQPPGSIGEALGRMVAGLPKTKSVVEKKMHKEPFNVN